MGKGADGEQGHGYLRRATEAAAIKATNLYEMSKTYTPNKILAIEEHLEERLKGLEGKAQLLETSTHMIHRIDQGLDSVADRVEGMMTGSHATAEKVLKDTQAGVKYTSDSLVTSVAFVTSNVTKSFTRTGSEDDLNAEEASELAMCEKLSSALTQLDDKYQQCLVSIDQGVELWLPVTEPEEESAPAEAAAAMTATRVGVKAAKKLKLAAFDRLKMVQRRSTKQIDTMVTVDLIQYASEQMDAVCGLARKARTKVADTKAYVKTTATEVKDVVQSHVSQTVATVADAKTLVTDKVSDAIAPRKAACEDTLHNVYVFASGKWSLVTNTTQYAKLTSAYEQAVEQCQGIRAGSIASIAFFEEKTAVLFTDGAVALVDNLRSEGRLPEQGQVSVKNLAALLVALAKPAPLKAQELVETVYTQLIEASHTAPAQLQARTHKMIGYCRKIKVENIAAFVQAKASEFVSMAKTSPEQAQALACKLYSQLHELAVPWMQTVQSFKAVTGTEVLQLAKSQLEVAKSQFEHLYGRAAEQVSGNRSIDYLTSIIQSSTSKSNYLTKVVANAAAAASTSTYGSQFLQCLPATTEIQPTKVYQHAKSQWEKLYSHLTKQVSGSRVLQYLPDASYPTQVLECARSQWDAYEQSAKQRMYGLANQGFDVASQQLLGAVKAAPYGEQAFSHLGHGLARTPLWSFLPTKVAALFPSSPMNETIVEDKVTEDEVEVTATEEAIGEDEVVEEVVTTEENHDILFTKDPPASPRDPLDESSHAAEADQEAIYEQGERYFDICDKNGDGSLTKSELKNFAKKPAGALLKDLFANNAKGWADLWQLIDVNEDGTFSKDAFASAYAQMAYSA